MAALSHWRADAEYAVLCAPYFQYPHTSSQIYAQALENDVCLMSWEHLIFLISNGIKENAEYSLAPVWGCSGELARQTYLKKKQKCFLPLFNATMVCHVGRADPDLKLVMNKQIASLHMRAEKEKQFWMEEIDTINSYTRQEAIEELIKARKIREKVAQINAYVERLKG